LVIPPPVQTAELSDDPTAISSLVTQASTVFIAAAESSIDMALAASAGGHVAGPVLIASSQQLPAATVAEIERLQPERLVLIGGSQRLDEVIDESLIARFPDVRVDRTAGADRVATAVAVSQRFHPSGASRVMLVASDADADAVVAAAQRSPLLLTFARFAPEATLAEIQRLNPGRITIVGGSARVDELVVEQLRVRFPGVLIEQVGGSDRYETAARLSAVGTSRVLIIDGRLEQSELFTAAAVAGMGNRTLLFGRPECSPDVNRPFYVNRSVTSIGRLGVGSCG
jgi:putative cell wall-binding protein